MNLRSYSRARVNRQAQQKPTDEKAAGSSNPAASKDHHNMATVAEAAGSGSDELHPDGLEVARIALVGLPNGERVFTYRTVLAGEFREFPITRAIGKGRAQHIMAAILSLVEAAEDHDEASVAEVILSAAYRIAARHMANDRRLIEELGRG